MYAGKLVEQAPSMKILKTHHPYAYGLKIPSLPYKGNKIHGEYSRSIIEI